MIHGWFASDMNAPCSAAVHATATVAALELH